MIDSHVEAHLGTLGSEDLADWHGRKAEWVDQSAAVGATTRSRFAGASLREREAGMSAFFDMLIAEPCAYPSCLCAALAAVSLPRRTLLKPM
jgi:hypothetical protein